jgi:hypothetical protein
LKRSLSAVADSQSKQRSRDGCGKISFLSDGDEGVSEQVAFASALDLQPTSKNSCCTNVSAALMLKSVSEVAEAETITFYSDSGADSIMLQDRTVAGVGDNINLVTSNIPDESVVSVMVPDAARKCLHENSSADERPACTTVVPPAVRLQEKPSRINCLGGMDFRDDVEVSVSGDCFNIGGEENFEPDYDFDEEKICDLLGELPQGLKEAQSINFLPSGLSPPQRELPVLSVSADDVRTVSLRKASPLAETVNLTTSQLGGERQTDAVVTAVKKIKIIKPGSLSITDMPPPRKRSWRPSSNNKQTVSNYNKPETTSKKRRLSTATCVVDSLSSMSECAAGADDQLAQLQSFTPVRSEASVKHTVAVETKSMVTEQSQQQVLQPESVSTELSVTANSKATPDDEEFLEGDWYVEHKN